MYNKNNFLKLVIKYLYLRTIKTVEIVNKAILTSMLLVANSTPIVDFDSKLNSFLVNLDNKLLFPTPESPIRTTKTCHHTFSN